MKDRTLEDIEAEEQAGPFVHRLIYILVCTECLLHSQILQFSFQRISAAVEIADSIE